MDKAVWFEEFTAWALLEAGASEVALNYTAEWSRDSENEIKERRLKRHFKENFIHFYLKENTYHRTEIDILAIYKGKYFVISCKSGFMKTKEEYVSELKGTTQIFERFAITLLSYFRHRGQPQEITGNIWY